jgi:thiosulfate dehydrogenase
MIERQPNFSTWAAGLLFMGLAVFIGYKIPHEQIPLMPVPTPTPQSKPAAIKENDIKTAFQPPSEDKIPDDEFGQIMKLGADIFHDTQRNAKEFAGNSLQCANCQIDKGRLANSAPLWAAYVAFPACRAKNNRVNTLQERIQRCFRFCMNGKAPDLNSKVLVARESYAHFLASGAPTGAEMPGRGYPKLPKPAKLNYGHGQEVYGQKCALCHGADGQGQQACRRHDGFPATLGAALIQLGRRHEFDHERGRACQSQYAIQSRQYAFRPRGVGRYDLSRQPGASAGSTLQGFRCRDAKSASPDGYVRTNCQWRSAGSEFSTIGTIGSMMRVNPSADKV